MIIVFLLLLSLPCFAGESSQQPLNPKSLFETHQKLAVHLLDDQENQNNYRQTLIERAALLSQEFFGEDDHAALITRYPTINNTYLFGCLGDYESLKELTHAFAGYMGDKNYKGLSNESERIERLNILIKQRGQCAPAKYVSQPTDNPMADDFAFYEDESAFKEVGDEEFQPTVLAPKEIDKKGKKRARNG